MRLVIMGPPAAGKGSQAPFITNEYNVPHISTGQMFREFTKQDTELGKRIKEVLAKGHLIEDDLTNEMVKERLSQKDVEKGFLLDGYPRNIRQAQFLDEFLQEKGLKLDFVISLYCDEEIIVKRIVGRRSCPTCGRIYNVYFTKPEVDGICDDDKTPLTKREDDTKEVAIERLRVYHKQTEPLYEYYKQKGLILDVDGGLPLSQDTFEQVKQAIGGHK